ncbi:MAG: tetratricopeptide repeat protein [Acidobacteria bacterium]|nr:tetratricopeptide repeat protein [Acidobacteriota bacterium]
MPVLLYLMTMAAWANEEMGSGVCAECHAAIAKQYAITGMARTAGAVSPRLVPAGEFTHAPSSVRYRLEEKDKGIEMQFSRAGSDWSGARRLEWFVGSGGLGRSFLFSAGSFLFQAPISYYASSGKWQISPGYERLPRMDLTRAVEGACLQCHASRTQPIAGTQNGFAQPPFLEGGVSCERCHGAGKAHVEAMRRGAKASTAIVNPAKLDAAARDSVCAQCHLTGAARVARRNAGSARYQPGARLSDTLAVFVWPQMDGSPDATSHYERLNRSACKKASGDKLWCGSCHDPHGAREQSAAHYRARCESCHRQKGCAEKAAVRQARGNDCVACHMPKGESHMVEHVAFTDHGIVRRAPGAMRERGARELTAFFPGAEERDLAMAYSVVAMTEPAVRLRALQLLEAAAARDKEDVAVLAQLAQFRDRMGRADLAEPLYERVLLLDPGHGAAAVNLGIYRVKRGDTAGAISLWERALRRNPAQTGVRTNLAVALAQSGKLAEAEAALLQALEYDPDAEAPRRLLGEIRGRR